MYPANFRSGAISVMRSFRLYPVLRFFKNLLHASSQSFSQTGEDLIIQKYFKDERITYIDVGSGEPILRSNSYLFYKKGYSGILVDPLKTNMILTKLMRPRDKFVCSLVGENVGLKQFIEYEAYEYSSMSQPFSVNEQNSEKLDMKIRHTHLLPVRTLNDIAAKHLDTSIPWFLSIDVEGADFEVLKSYDFEFSKPYLICIEDHNYQRNQFSLQNNYIMNLGYKLVEKTDLSLIYILDVN